LQCAGSDIDRRGRDTTNIQQVAADEPSHDIDERIHQSDFVEMHMVHCDAMGFGFCLGEPLEYGAALLLDFPREPALGKCLPDTAERPGSRKTGRDDDVYLRRRNGATLHSPFTECKARDAESFESLDQLTEGCTRIHKRTQRHIPADSGKAVKVEVCAHAILSLIVRDHSGALGCAFASR
jgi:hypothetical protein